MTEFGQNLIPSIYEDNTFRTFSKAGFVSHMCRALQTVGMVPLTGLWPYDPIASPEFPIQIGQTYIFPFDYPDDGGTLTWNVSGTLYRPCFLVIMWHGNEDLITNPTRLETHVVVEGAIRIDGAPTLDNIFPMTRTRGVTGTIGVGTGTAVWSSTYVHTDGHQIQKEDWLPYQGSSAGNQSELPIGHWFVYLGPGGLQIYCGSGNLRTAFGDIMATGTLFCGARLPGRARPVTEDSNLTRMNPICQMYWVETNTNADGNSYWTTSISASAELYTQQFRPKVHRMQADLNSTDEIVNSWLFNLENVEYPIFPLYQPDTRPSPRAISGGGGGHILAYGVQVPDSREDDSADKFGPIVPSLNASEVRPQWEDVFTGPGWRWCDQNAPLGLHTDPNTLLDWYLVPTYQSNQLVGLLQENGTIVDTLVTLTLTASGSDYYNLTGAGGWSNSFPTPVTITETGTGTTVWDDASASDEQTFAVPDLKSTQAYEVQWDITIAGGDPDDTQYTITFDAFNRDDPQTGTQNSEGLNDLTFEYFFNGSWVVSQTIECAGDNTMYTNSEGQLSYSLQSYDAGFVPKDTSQGTPQLTVRWQADGDDDRGSNGAVGNIRVNKFRYL
jgi:hypothetical protein